MRTRWYGVLSYLAVLLLATGCFQQAGSPSGITPIAQALPTSTPSLPSDTPLPPATDTPVQESTDRPLPTSTPIALATQTQGTGGSVLQVTSPVVTLSVSTQVAQAEPLQQEEDPLNITATAIIQRATQTAAANLTATWQAQFGTPIPLATATPVFVPGATATPTTVAAPGGSCVHVVAAGDNMFRISLRYNVPINDIAAANGISNPNIIVVGQSLTIPRCNSAGGTVPTTPVPGGTRTHTVQQGETLFQISLQYGVPVNSIAAANGISNINLIFINQQLVIPAA